MEVIDIFRYAVNVEGIVMKCELTVVEWPDHVADMEKMRTT